MTLWQANTDPGSSTRPPLPVLESQDQTQQSQHTIPSGVMAHAPP